MEPVQKVLKDAGVSKSNIDDIVLVGRLYKGSKNSRLLKAFSMENCSQKHQSREQLHMDKCSSSYFIKIYLVYY